MFHHRKKARIAVRSVGDCEFKVAGLSPALGRAARRILHPIDVDDDVPLDLDRCLDRVLVKAHQYVNTGQFFDA